MKWGNVHASEPVHLTCSYDSKLMGEYWTFTCMRAYCNAQDLFQLENCGGFGGLRAEKHQCWVWISLNEGKALLDFKLHESKALNRPLKKTVATIHPGTWVLTQNDLPINPEAYGYTQLPCPPALFKVIGLSHFAAALIFQSYLHSSASLLSDFSGIISCFWLCTSPCKSTLPMQNP